MLTITFVTHSTSLDNEAGLASGHFDVALSDVGREQARAQGERYAGKRFAAVFSSDLLRARETAEIAFGSGGAPLRSDSRLRECDYGELTRRPRAEVEAMRGDCIERPFPGGESYGQVAERMRAFLEEAALEYAGGHIVIVGHRATQDCLEHLANGVALEETVGRSWEWQPGWTYQCQAVPAAE